MDKFSRNRSIVKLCQTGPLTQEQIAQSFEIRQGRVSQLYHQFQVAGEAGLVVKPTPGAPAKLTKEQRAQLPDLLSRGAESYGFDRNHSEIFRTSRGRLLLIINSRLYNKHKSVSRKVPVKKRECMYFSTAPLSYTVEITYACNNACSGCINAWHTTTPVQELQNWLFLFDLISPPVSRLQYAEVIRITGGEPTLHKHFTDILKYIDTFGIPLHHGSVATSRYGADFLS